MIFVGDIALPYSGAIGLDRLPIALKGRSWFGNLEGAAVTNTNVLNSQHAVFNDKEAIRSLATELNFVGFALGNNHIFDIGSFADTVGFLKEIQVPYIGIGRDLHEASTPLILKEGNAEIVILNFGWEVIQCKVVKGKASGVNPLEKVHVLKTVDQALKSFPNAAIIPFMHWSYELEDTPQPMERELAKRLIDMGVAGVIGCHPHRIGGFEMYKNKPILYSLGNWMFKQNYYHGGKLKFPDFCSQELAFEWDFISNELKFHFFDFDRKDSKLVYSHSEDVESDTMIRYTPFRNLSDQEYKVWYKGNHYHRRKGLPIYYWEDTPAQVLLKNKINKVRDFFVYHLSKLRRNNRV